ncbi:Zn-ribbon domain-containing OB-fold protein [Actinomadura sp. SCN-SB]|uniref:Zn-ribbon domain-containing OB-fold protein n=1 Tax=Actinomadura sp. SCN-SB TaxID=3373092 RepID=UPI0037517E87
MQQVPLAEGLFTWPPEPSRPPALIGGRASNGKIFFPCRAQAVVDGVREDLERVELPRRGLLWTFTSQHFRPPAPPYAGADDAQTFRPFTVGYVELPGALHVEARLTEPDPAKLRIGQEMELVIEPFGVDTEGNQTMVYAFAPVAGEGSK